MKYTTNTNVKNYIGSDIQTPDTVIDSWIDAMSEHINQTTGFAPLVFDASSTAVSKRYDGKGGTKLMIDNILEGKVDSVHIGSTEITDFEVISNSEHGGYILFVPGGIPKGEYNVKVTGKFGKYAETPADIEFACTILVAGAVNHAEPGTDKVRSESIGRYTVTYASESQSNDYKRVESILKTHEKITIL